MLLAGTCTTSVYKQCKVPLSFKKSAWQYHSVPGILDSQDSPFIDMWQQPCVRSKCSQSLTCNAKPADNTCHMVPTVNAFATKLQIGTPISNFANERVNWHKPKWFLAVSYAHPIRDATPQKKRDFLGIFPKCRTPPLPPFWEPLFPKKKSMVYFAF